MTTRRRLLSTTLAALALAPLTRPLLARTPPAFPQDGFETLTTTIATAQGDRRVTYRFWRAIPYVAVPVDAAHQSLNLSVPVEIDGTRIDATRAPILFQNSVGGYLPSDMSTAEGVGEGKMGPPPPGMGGAMGAEAPSGSAEMMARGERVSNAKLALAAGFVVCEPGARGRTLKAADGTHIGTAPAAIVDLKAAVRYLRANAGAFPGDTDRIISAGTSAGGALSALLAASADQPDYDSALAALGAADASDTIFACAAWCPITDLDHADAAYEWCWGTNPPGEGATVDPGLSATLAAQFPARQAALALTTPEGEALTAETLGPHLVTRHLLPEATAFLAALSPEDRAAYLAAHPAIGWTGSAATFDWPAFLSHVGPRKKSAPAFDAPDLSTGENNLFGTGTTPARHFTDFGLQLASGDATARIDDALRDTVRLMNPMGFLAAANSARPRHWWLRTGARDTDTSLSVITNLATQAQSLGDDVSLRFYWDAGHGANEDADAFLDWISRLTGYPRA